MKWKLLIVTMLLISTAQAQEPGYNPSNTRMQVQAIYTDSGLHVPGYNIRPYLRNKVSRRAGALGLDSVGHKLYYYSGGAWRRLADSAALAAIVAGSFEINNLDTGYRLWDPVTPGMKTLLPGDGIDIDSTSSDDAITIRADTNYLATIDSVIDLISSATNQKFGKLGGDKTANEARDFNANGNDWYVQNASDAFIQAGGTVPTLGYNWYSHINWWYDYLDLQQTYGNGQAEIAIQPRNTYSEMKFSNKLSGDGSLLTLRNDYFKWEGGTGKFIIDSLTRTTDTTGYEFVLKHRGNDSLKTIRVSEFLPSASVYNDSLFGIGDNTQNENRLFKLNTTNDFMWYSPAGAPFDHGWFDIFSLSADAGKTLSIDYSSGESDDGDKTTFYLNKTGSILEYNNDLTSTQARLTVSPGYFGVDYFKGDNYGDFTIDENLNELSHTDVIRLNHNNGGSIGASYVDINFNTHISRFGAGAESHFISRVDSAMVNLKSRSSSFIVSNLDFKSSLLSSDSLLFADNTGKFFKIASSVIGGSGVTTLSAVGSSPNANAATISGSTLNLEPASSSQPGVVTTATQSFTGIKKFLTQAIVGSSTTPVSVFEIGGNVNGSVDMALGNIHASGTEVIRFNSTVGTGNSDAYIQRSNSSGRFEMMNGHATANLVLGTNNTDRVTINGATGAMKLGPYGAGAITGTPAYTLQVDASGNVIEGALGGSGLTIGTTAIASGTAGRILYEGAGNFLQEDADFNFDGTQLYNSSDQSANSGIRTGSIELQGFALNNAWVGENAYYNVGFKARQTGYGELFYFVNGEGAFRMADVVTAGSAFSFVQPLKISYTGSGTVGIGGDISTTTGSFSNASILATSSLVTFNDPTQHELQLKMKEIAAPSTPASGYALIYPKSDGLWYGKDDAGVETKLSNDAGGGGSLATLTDVTLTSIAANDFLKYNGSAWINRTPANVRTDLSLVPGTDVQAYDADLTTWAGITPGSNVGTFLATPSSSNLRAAITDENGTGALLFSGATSPSFTTPVFSSITNTGTLTLPTVTGTVVQKTISTITSNATWSPAGDASVNYYDISAQAVAATTISAPSGTPSNGNELYIRVVDNGTARAISGWNAIYVAGTNLSFPTTTTLGKYMVIKFVYNTMNSINKWQLVAVLDGL